MKCSLYVGINTGSLIFVEYHSKLIGIDRNYYVGMNTVSLIVMSVKGQRLVTNIYMFEVVYF